MNRGAAGKQQLRQTARRALQAMSAGERVAASRQACDRLLNLEAWRRAGTVLLFSPLPDELDVTPLVEAARRAGKTCALPGYIPETGLYGPFALGEEGLRTGPYGVPEPAGGRALSLKGVDFVLVPGVGFEKCGGRLGRGKGFYDRLLAEANGVKCGICFEGQILDGIPLEPHDVLMDHIVTPARWLDCAAARSAKKHD